MTDSSFYDYAIIGAGAAGINLALAMQEDAFFAEKKILILDKDTKEKDDRTWSFWEMGTGKWDKIITKSWEKGLFNTRDKSIKLSLHPYRYKTLSGLAFYQHAKKRLAQANNIHWLQEEVKTLVLEEYITIKGLNKDYQARQVFDSRIDPCFEREKGNYFSILQHFKGWEIETTKPTFDPTTFVMMDFQVKWKNSTSFTYVLPITPTKALVEFTLFTQDLIAYDAYDALLKKYIVGVLGLKDYKISKVEYGVIPMSDYPFQQANKPGITKIGTAGAQVKPSSGYAFKNCELSAQHIINNIKRNRPPHKGLITKKFRLYDSLYLDVLSNHNHLGESIFTDMYTKNSIQQIFKFLDEQTSLIEDISIINSFQVAPFLQALSYKILGWRFPSL